MVDKVFLVVFQDYKTIICAINFYSVKYISSFCKCYAFFVYITLRFFGSFSICCSYCIVYEVIALIFCLLTYTCLRFCLLASAFCLNPAKNKMGTISKAISDKIIICLWEKLKVNEWKNTTDDINWFEKIYDFTCIKRDKVILLT